MRTVNQFPPQLDCLLLEGINSFCFFREFLLHPMHLLLMLGNFIAQILLNFMLNICDLAPVFDGTLFHSSIEVYDFAGCFFQFGDQGDILVFERF